MQRAARGVRTVCVCWGDRQEERGCQGDNDKHHLGSLITEVHQSTVPPVCLRKSSIDGLDTHPHKCRLCLILLYHFTQSFILPANSQPYRGHQRALLLYKQAWSDVIHLLSWRPLRCRSFSHLLSPSRPAQGLTGDEGLRRNRPSEELPA